MLIVAVCPMPPRSLAALVFPLLAAFKLKGSLDVALVATNYRQQLRTVDVLFRPREKLPIEEIPQLFTLF